MKIKNFKRRFDRLQKLNYVLIIVLSINFLITTYSAIAEFYLSKYDRAFLDCSETADGKDGSDFGWEGVPSEHSDLKYFYTFKKCMANAGFKNVDINVFIVEK